MRELILGAARSGKSSLALRRAHDSGRSVIFVATARASDDEMQARILRHRNERPSGWRTLESPVHLARALSQADDRNAFIIVDCLTLWLSNVLCDANAGVPQFNEVAWRQESSALRDVLPTLQADIVLVSNEVGWGIVPENPVARRFRDEQGRLNQMLATLCETVSLVVAGLPLTLKSTRG
ncbi:MAG TPA: bifunctional adenosylcobinamide kinase/adenosylcobinamide-phosphate guanylyltransferase [Steroidobacteraceae bacterium]|nr:bifunctional adenosylcobinamide kinase/adenosylcobinamide-phosphate guanylyltransferase [Steroidobacteraceae bacterium]